jgi:hypothetical protein
MKNFIKITFMTLCMVMLFANADATSLSGGDAANQSSADSILDIVFAADTSVSIFDDIEEISDVAQASINNLNCPQGDIWVRANFLGIAENTKNIFDPVSTDYLTNLSGVTFSDLSSDTNEDNGPVVSDLIKYYDFNDNSASNQDYYKAVVSIGDEGTEDGLPILNSDLEAAFKANQNAVQNNTFLFSWVTDPRTDATSNVFEDMAIGGTNGGYNYDDTGGAFIDGSESNISVQQNLEDIFCTAGSGGTGTKPVPEPTTWLLFGTGLLGLAGLGRKKIFKRN